MVVILGLGFTGIRLARRLLKRGIPVGAAVRGKDRFGDLAAAGLQLADLDTGPGAFPKHVTIFHSIPPPPPTEGKMLGIFIGSLEPDRVVYISSTGIYGAQELVNHHTPPRPAEGRAWSRMREENRLSIGPWTSLILRSAAIYGPGRGVHAAIRNNRLPRGLGTGIVSRVHVDDLAALAEAGLFADLQGAWPVADEDPCATAGIVRWCGGELENEPSTRTAGRRVDGKKIFERLGVEPHYRSWRTGVPASIAEENERANSPPPSERA